MKTKVINTPLCECCNQELHSALDGIIVKGAIFPAGTEVNSCGLQGKPLVGKDFSDARIYPEAEYQSSCAIPVYALCWVCLHKAAGK